MTCILNADDVEKIIKTPGRRYLGPKGTEMAAIKIQVAGSFLNNATQLFTIVLFVHVGKSKNLMITQ